MGSGPSLGFLTFLGYLLFVAGAAALWKLREDLSVWAQGEFHSVRRLVARHMACAGIAGLREHERFKIFPGYFFCSLDVTRRERIARAVLLLFAGPVLFLLDFLL